MSKKSIYIEKKRYIWYSLYRVEVIKMNREMKRKIIGSIIGVIAFAALIVGATYAWLIKDLVVSNANYVASTGCFDINYDITNPDNPVSEITGDMIPAAHVTGGLSGRVGLRTKDNCEIEGTATLNLHVNGIVNGVTVTDPKLLTTADSYCQSRKTLEKIDGITTKLACETAGNRWMPYGDDYCENSTTLERLVAYTDSSSCSGNGGTWKSGGSPLKYAVYDNASGTGTPVGVGSITAADIDGDDVILATDIEVTSTQQYYYIFIWLDGYLTDSTYAGLPFNGSISATVVQSE